MHSGDCGQSSGPGRNVPWDFHTTDARLQALLGPATGRFISQVPWAVQLPWVEGEWMQREMLGN